MGVPGEIYIGGAGVAIGYLNDPERSATSFIDLSLPGGVQRVYRTGDLAQWTAETQLDFLGRIDQQVKVRGFRVELEDIDFALQKHPDVEVAQTLAQNNLNEEQQLLSFVTLKSTASDTVTPQSLRIWIGKALPNYMVPSQIHIIDAFPLGATGKIDRAKLLTITSTETIPATAQRKELASLSNTERWLIDQLEHQLRITKPNLHDNFFDLGGHSLQAVRLVAEIARIFQKNIPLSTLLTTATLQEFAKEIDNHSGNDNWSVLVPIRKGGSRPPIFMVHAVGGNVLGFSDFADHLHHEQPLIGIQANGFNPGQTPNADLKAMASHYVNAPTFWEVYPWGGSLRMKWRVNFNHVVFRRIG